MALFECRSLTKKIGTYGLADIDFDLEGGTILGLIGINGCGKTTVVHAMMDTLQELYDRKLKSPNETVFLIEHKKKTVLFHLTGSAYNPQRIESSFELINFTYG